MFSCGANDGISAAIAGGKLGWNRCDGVIGGRKARLFPLRAAEGSVIAPAVQIVHCTAGVREHGAENANTFNHRDTEYTVQDTEGLGIGFMSRVSSCQLLPLLLRLLLRYVKTQVRVKWHSACEQDSRKRRAQGYYLEEHLVTIAGWGANYFEGAGLLRRLAEGWKIVYVVSKSKLLNDNSKRLIGGRIAVSCGRIYALGR